MWNVSCGWGSEFSWGLRRVLVGRTGYLLADVLWVAKIRDGEDKGWYGQWRERKSRREGGKMEERVEDRDMSRERATSSVVRSN
jgi:hypothetical protein